MTFEEILHEYNVEIAPEGHHHSREGWIQFDCPKCGKDSHKFHMGYSLASGYVHCWKCGFIPLIEVVSELTGLHYNEARELIKDLETDYVEPIRPKGKLTLPKGLKPLRKLKQHQEYLRSRGYDWKEIKNVWKVQGIPTAKRLGWRLFIPIFFHGEMVSWTTRTISNDPNINRYLSAKPEEETLPHKTLLYGEDLARHAIIIVEGPIDVWRIGPGAVATFGTGVSQAQILRMVQFPIRAICFDAEPAAQKEAKKLLNNLSTFPGETYLITLETGKDASDASEEEIEELRKEILL